MSWFFGKVNKVDKILAKLTKRNREKTQINAIRNEVTVDTITMQKTVTTTKNCIPNTGKSQRNGQVPRLIYVLPKLNQEDIKILNNTITSHEIDGAMKIPQT